MSVFTGTATGHLDMMNKLEQALCDQGHAWGKTFVGTGNGTLTGAGGAVGGYKGGATSVVETFTITFTSATAFTVSGSVTGALAAGTVGVLYSHARIEFLITAGATAFVAGDVFTLNTSLKYEVVRKLGVRSGAFLTGDMINNLNLYNNNGGSYAYKATVNLPMFAQMELLYPTEVKRVDLFAYILSGTIGVPTAFNLQYSDDGVSWTTHQSWSGQTWGVNYERKQLDVTGSPGSHKYWKMVFTAGTAGVNQHLSGVNFFDATAQFSLTDRAEIIFKGFGLDGSKDIQFGAEFYENAGANTFNFNWYALRNFNGALNLRSQLPAMELVCFPLQNQALTYWFFVNGQRVVVIAKLGVIYISGYFGFGFPYDLPSVHSYPMIMAAASSTETDNVANVTPNQRSIASPGRYSMKAWYPAAGWKSHSNWYDLAGNSSADYSTEGHVWPSMLGYTYSANPMRDNIDGSMPLLPCILMHQVTPKHIWGEMDGVFYTTGFNNTVESTITKNGEVFKVFQDNNRSDYQSFFAVRMD